MKVHILLDYIIYYIYGNGRHTMGTFYNGPIVALHDISYDIQPIGL